MVNPQTPGERKLCLSQWVCVLLIGLLGGAVGAMLSPESASVLEKLPAIGIGLMIGLTVAGIGMTLYMRWKRSRVRS